MARYLALDWDYQQLRVVAATIRAGQLHLEQAALWPVEQSPNPAEAEALGRRLRERLKSAGIAPAPVLACVGRERVILKDVRYPSVSAAEEPAVIRFQVVKDLTDPADEAVIDYVPLGEAAAGEEQRALVLIVRREWLTAYQTLCRSAGLKLLALTPRPFGTLACLRESVKKWESGRVGEWECRSAGAPDPAGSSLTLSPSHSPTLPPSPSPTTEAVAVLTAADRWSEFCLVRGDTLVLARSLPAGPALAAEVRRNLAVYSAQTPRHTVRALYLADGAEEDTLRAGLQESLAIPVHSFDPFAGMERPDLPGEQRGTFAGAVGLLRAQARGRALPINFVSPKQPRPPRDLQKSRLAVAAGVAALVLVGVVYHCYSGLADKDRELDALHQVKTVLESQSGQVKEEARRLEELGEWSRSNVSWLDEFYNLTALFPDPKAIQLSHVIADDVPAAAKDKKDKQVARMTLKGVTTNEDQAVDGLSTALEYDGHYVPGPKDMSGETPKGQPPFTRPFTMYVDVAKQPPTMYAARLPEFSAAQLAEERRLRPLVRPTGSTSAVQDTHGAGVAVPGRGGKVRHALSPPGESKAARPPQNTVAIPPANVPPNNGQNAVVPAAGYVQSTQSFFTPPADGKDATSPAAAPPATPKAGEEPVESQPSSPNDVPPAKKKGRQP